MKYYLIAGEASGDLHGANLMKELKKQDPRAEFRCWGGDLMEAAGGHLVKHYRELAFMGFIEVVQNLRTILKNIRRCKEDIETYQPDALILIDYPGFNLRIAKWAGLQDLKVFYYISPQVWAWKARRVYDIQKYVDRMFVILPFEPDFYRKYDYEVHFVGHPLLDTLQDYTPPADFLPKNGLSEKPLIALVPGSRRQEIKTMLSIMLDMVDFFPAYQFAIAGAPSIPADFYRDILDHHPRAQQVRVLTGQTYDLISQAEAALVTSGTATLETALLGTPEVVCYRGNPLSYLIARQLVDIPYISLVNLILDRPLVRELIQKELNPQELKLALENILSEPGRSTVLAGYRELRAELGQQGASRRTAAGILEFLTGK